MTPSIIKSGFKAPYGPSAIPEEAFKPSTASNLPDPEATEPGTTSIPTTSSVLGPSSPQPGTSSGLLASKRPRARLAIALINNFEEDSSSKDEILIRAISSTYFLLQSKALLRLQINRKLSIVGQ